MKNATEWATIGTIVAPFGIRGELKVFPLTDIPDRFLALKTVYINLDYARYTIEGVRPYKGTMLLLKFKEIQDATTAEKFRNAQICIPISELATLPPDLYYQHDIMGLQVLHLNNAPVGIITDIITTGGNDVYVVKAED